MVLKKNERNKKDEGMLDEVNKRRITKKIKIKLVGRALKHNQFIAIIGQK